MEAICFSLLTCSPGDEVYSLYGHTALRVVCVDDGGELADGVFNYGVFSFGAPHFVWRFCLGQTDYEVRLLPTERFLASYAERGSGVVEQRLLLSPAEAERLLEFLSWETLPENCVYRYNFLSANCTTKVRDAVEACVDGEVSYAPAEPATYRSLMHGYTSAHAWQAAGQDLFLGHGCDTLLSARARLFLPEELSGAWEQAEVIEAGGARHRLCDETTVLVQPKEHEAPSPSPFSPGVFGCLLLGLTLAMCLLERRMGRRLWWFDIALLLPVGVVGLAVSGLFFFSEHPTVGENWQLWVFNPLPLVALPWVVRGAIKRRRCWWDWYCVVSLALFLVCSPFIGQDLSPITLPVAVCLLGRSVASIRKTGK